MARSRESYGTSRNGVSCIAGIWTANTPPGASIDSRPRKQPRAVHPLQRGVRVDQIGRLIRLPREEVRLLEPAAGRRGARLVQHRRRAIHTGDIRRGKALSQDRSDIAGSAPQIDHARRRVERHPRQQIQRRAQPLIGKAQILCRIPDRGGTRHQCRPCSLRSKCRLMSTNAYATRATNSARPIA